MRRPARQVGPVVLRAGMQLDDADRHVVGGGRGILVEDGRAREIELECDGLLGKRLWLELGRFWLQMRVWIDSCS